MGKIIGLIGIVIVIGVAAYWYTNQMDRGSNSALMDARDAAQDAKEAVENQGMVASIKDAMASGIAMSCTYKTTEDNNPYEGVVVVQGEKFRGDVVVNNNKTHALFDGETQYVWAEGSKTGFKMTKVCLDEMSKSAPQGENQASVIEDAKASFDSASDVDCSPTTDTNFSVPSDVTFTDQCAQMQDAMKMMEQYKSQIQPAQ